MGGAEVPHDIARGFLLYISCMRNLGALASTPLSRQFAAAARSCARVCRTLGLWQVIFSMFGVACDCARGQHAECFFSSVNNTTSPFYEDMRTASQRGHIINNVGVVSLKNHS